MELVNWDFTEAEGIVHPVGIQMFDNLSRERNEAIFTKHWSFGFLQKGQVFRLRSFADGKRMLFRISLKPGADSRNPLIP